MLGPFPTHPSHTLVREILRHIRDTGKPETWWGHSHTRPPQGATVVYLEEFDLPASHHKPDKWASCPVCSPRNPKYFRKGKIAWFPEEGVIRMIGGHCYVSIFGQEQHDAALEQLRRDQKRRSNDAFIKSQIPKISSYFGVLEENLALCQAIDNFRGRLLPKMGSQIHTRLWSHVRASGELRTTVDVVERRLVGGREVSRDTQQENRYGSLNGYKILRPPPYDALAPRVREAISQLRELLHGDNPLANHSPDRLSNGIRKLTLLWDKITNLSNEAHVMKKFVDLANIKTLKAWSGRNDTPIEAFFDIRGGTLMVGNDERNFASISIPPEMLSETRQIPPISSKSIGFEAEEIKNA